jgi:cell division protein FtsI (penicillin-binding protein 3)
MSVFPMNAPRYAVYMMLDEPKANASTHGYATAGWVSAPAAGRVIARIGPMLGLLPDTENGGGDQRLALHPAPARPSAGRQALAGRAGREPAGRQGTDRPSRRRRPPRSPRSADMNAAVPLTDVWPEAAGLGLRGMTADSRAVKPGFLFAALPGAKADGRAFIAERGGQAGLSPCWRRWRHRMARGRCAGDS